MPHFINNTILLTKFFTNTSIPDKIIIAIVLSISIGPIPASTPSSWALAATAEKIGIPPDSAGGLASDPDNTSTSSQNYCERQNCEWICADLRDAYSRGDGEKIKQLTETYHGSGDYCGY
ncbi:MAG: hypothetical protein M3162_05480 [Thermoproteota archaeon]|nr:hypothetical protein [Thermoproteota archaeon]